MSRGGTERTANRLEEHAAYRDGLPAPKQVAENLVDSYREQATVRLEALPSETRHRVYRSIELAVTTRAGATLLANLVTTEAPGGRAPGLVS